MKKLILTCTLVASVTVLFAQGAKATAPSSAPATATTSGSPAEQAASKQANIYKAQLGLTAEQYKGVYNAELDYASQEQGFRASGQPTPASIESQLMTAHDTKFQSILTSAQYAKYTKSKGTNTQSGKSTSSAMPAGH